MGIDIYARWKGMEKREEDAQYTGFSIYAGDKGYLREAYHGEPYATEFFVKEVFESKDGEVKIPAKTLLERLPKTLGLVKKRNKNLYDDDELRIFYAQKSYVDFYELCKKKEKETGEPCTIVASY